MQFFKPCNNDLIQCVFEYIPEDELLKNCTSVSKDLNKAVGKNESCSIIQTTLSIAQSALTGQINSIEMFADSIQCDINGSQTTHDCFLGSKTVQTGQVKFFLKHDPLKEKAFIPFSVNKHTNFLEKSSTLYHLSSALLSLAKASLFGQEISSKDHNEMAAQITEIYTKNKLTDISVSYHVEEGKNRIKGVYFYPCFSSGKIYVDEKIVQNVQAFFSDHKIVIEDKKI